MTDKLIALSKTLYDQRISEMRSLLKEKPKRYLLIAGVDYYPGKGTRDWVGFFDTEEEAITAIDKSNDWYEVVDLHTWKEYDEEQVKRL